MSGNVLASETMPVCGTVPICGTVPVCGAVLPSGTMLLSKAVLPSETMLLSGTMLPSETMLSSAIESSSRFCFDSDLSRGGLRLVYDCRTNADVSQISEMFNVQDAIKNICSTLELVV